MTTPDDRARALADFDGTAPLFPLPNVVLFPRILLPLHIFEMRYRKMVADALEGNRLIAMALLQPGWEIHDPARVPDIHSTVCVGRIVTHERLSDGRYYLVLEGLSRARVERELETDQPYRTGVLRLLEPDDTETKSDDRERRRQELIEEFQKVFPAADLDEILQDVLSPTVSLGTFCDVLAYALRLEPEQAQEILAELRVDRRCDLLLRRIQAILVARGGKTPRTFPPPFSAN